ncbi:fumarylacetoacetate hydrolase family protein [Paraburkholderia sp. BR10954]|uniref:fumarylacetoacetate hydrolase family protein n=1 Tax=Paraburkholderia sp. BR10954 TaxID=3236995 RepID=UPI0034D2305A
MKIGSVHYEGASRIAVAVAEGEVAIVGRSGDGCSTTINQVIHAWPHALARFNAALEAAPRVNAESLHCLPPISDPGKIISVRFDGEPGDHGRATIAPKMRASLAGHRHPVRVRLGYGAVYPRPALAVIVGAAGEGGRRHKIPIFGYSVMNDLFASGVSRVQNGCRSFSSPPKFFNDADLSGLAGTFETFSPIGPMVVTRDDEHLISNAVISCWIGNKKILDWPLAGFMGQLPVMLSSVAELVGSLEPADVVAFSLDGKHGDVGHDLAETTQDVTIQLGSECVLSNPVMRCN